MVLTLGYEKGKDEFPKIEGLVAHRSADLFLKARPHQVFQSTSLKVAFYRGGAQLL